ncbi:MAG: HAD family phosphatase [Atopobiaceae bacterium]|nr:HAD family phosphatase [Atopobiaceae bacterium]
MPNKDIRLILTDIDGTILPYGKKQVSDRVRAAFHAAQDAGIHVGPASGRGFSYIPVTFGGDATCSATCLATNGMQVFLDGALIHQELLPRAPLVRIAKLLANVRHAGLICFEDGVPLLVEGDVADLEKSFPLYARESHHVTDVPAHDIEKANVFVAGDMAYTREVLEYLDDRIEGVGFDLPMAGFLNIKPIGWSKASGIDVMCDALGIGLDQVVVFGDGGNDVEMLAHVPHSVAVADAAPDAAVAAHWHIGTCEDESVAKAIEALAAREWPFGA